MNLLQRMKSRSALPAVRNTITTIEDYIGMFDSFNYNGLSYPFFTYGGSVSHYPGTGQTTEWNDREFIALATSAYEANGVVFACMMVRQLIFSSIRFKWQRMRDGNPSETFSTSDLQILNRPWSGGTTQDLLSRCIQDADLAGNAYLTRLNGELVRLRPDWVDIVVEPRMMPGRGQLGWKLAGYVYTSGGWAGGTDPVGLLPNEVAHFAPIPDPLSFHRGMSWLTPILREIAADQMMTRHQQKFFEHGATPNMIVKHLPGANEEKIRAFAEMMADRFGGVDNAYKTLHLYPGADATVVGANLKDIDFAQVRSGGEARIAAAAGVPPMIAGLQPGLDASTYSNYAQTRRRLSDGTAHPLWQNLAGSLEILLTKPRPVRDDVRLWYDATDVPFLREDEKDAAEIQQTRAATICALIAGGFTAESAIEVVESNDFGLLEHTGLTSVQLQKPGTPPPPSSSPPLPPPSPDDSEDDGEDDDESV